MRIDLVCPCSATGPPDWPLGAASVVAPTPAAVHALLSGGDGLSSDAILFWDASLGRPCSDRVRSALCEPWDVWHAGLRLGTGGLPGLIDMVAPTWMLNRDPDPGIEATSWRLSLRGCLVRTEVLHALGVVRPEFATLDAAALEMGHRFITKGAMMRHVPWLIADDAAGSLAASSTTEPMGFEDELRFIYYRFGRTWSRWACQRAVFGGYAPASTVWRASRRVCGEPRPVDPQPYRRDVAVSGGGHAPCTVTALVPTVDRYPYLRTLLGQLRDQTVPPAEIIVIDQTPKDRRDAQLGADFADLPLRILYQDTPGQCTSRNAGLEVSQGTHVLFLDDDDEVPANLIEKHLRAMRAHRSDVSCGVADEVGAGPLPPEFTVRRMADVFPTNNTLADRSALELSGLFDLAYNRGQRADRDLGMRVYLSGAAMVLSPEISVLHHHAPAGGLRTHKARVITYASSRNRLVHRQLPSATEMYLAQRYFTPRQMRESIWLSVLGTFSIRGGRLRKLLKAAISTVCIPSTLLRIRQRVRESRAMLRRYPQIPSLPALRGGPGAEGRGDPCS